MESVDKLRKWGEILGYAEHIEAYEQVMSFADEIEAEIERDYMLLPKDADGVPIHVGDEVCGYGYPDGGVVVKSLNGSMIIVGRLDGAENYAKSGLLWAAADTRHYHAPTVEDVLREYGRKVIEYHSYSGCMADAPSDPTDEYADKLREVMRDE